MAARRLIALLLALMAISVIATALAPPQRGGEQSSTTTTTSDPGPEAPEEKSGTTEPSLIAASVDASSPRTNDPVQAAAGDQLALTVRAASTQQIEISGLGLYDVAAPGAPARFDLVLRDEGRFAVLAEGERVATIFVGVEPAKKQRSKRDPAQSAAGRNEEPEPKGQKPRESGSSVAA